MTDDQIGWALGLLVTLGPIALANLWRWHRLRLMARLRLALELFARNARAAAEAFRLIGISSAEAMQSVARLGVAMRRAQERGEL